MEDSSSGEMQWTEKYRPRSLDEVKGQTKVIAATSKFLDPTTTLPHLLLYGPPGTGKTSTILAFLKQRYGKDWVDHTLVLNASDERGITMVRAKVKTFISSSSRRHKYVILDEADSMTEDAQSALRRVIEGAPMTSFCIICNYKARIIEPLQSRCCDYQFEPLDPETALAFLQDICFKEALKVERSTLERLIKATRGDLREAVGRLQNLASVLRAGMEVDLVHDEIQKDFLEDLAYLLRAKIEGPKEGTPRPSFRALSTLWETLRYEGHDLVSVLCALSDRLAANEWDEEDPMKSVDLLEAFDLLSSMTDQVMVMEMDPKLVFFRFVS